ncbi:MAG: hypothetical protein IKK57_00795 [Clostridia bacterium]|nr:hypothetical protein [Clostridia bacterium]
MTSAPFPTVAVYPLPASVAALPDAAPGTADAEAPPTEKSGGQEELIQAVSDAIARRARQRRYTP